MRTASDGILAKGEVVPDAQRSNNVASPAAAHPAYRGLNW